MENHELSYISENPKSWQRNTQINKELSKGRKDKAKLSYWQLKGDKILIHLLNVTKMISERNKKKTRGFIIQIKNIIFIMSVNIWLKTDFKKAANKRRWR